MCSGAKMYGAENVVVTLTFQREETSPLHRVSRFAPAFQINRFVVSNRVEVACVEAARLVTVPSRRGRAGIDTVRVEYLMMTLHWLLLCVRELVRMCVWVCVSKDSNCIE